MEMYPDGIYLSDSIYQSLENSIQRDCRVLETFKIMDYSLLIGIHNVDHASREDLASNNLTSNLTGGGISDGELDCFFLSCSSHILTISEFPHIVLTKKIQKKYIYKTSSYWLANGKKADIGIFNSWNHVLSSSFSLKIFLLFKNQFII